MKLNGKEIQISECAEESLGDELILYIEEYHKIVVLNQTAGTIWHYIFTCYNENIDIEINDIVNVLVNTYIDSLPDSETLFVDVKEIIVMLCSASLIVQPS